ncbi:MAG: 4a-hydroxytetrahydrobiopterin dehydratase [Alphaproteobacteria bacterium]|nr:4a-hydroxytetrahydrobiopterin dehydratase [Alphaproteobacteria bacterium]
MPISEAEREILSAEVVDELLSEHPGWTICAGVIERTWTFSYFRAGFAFLSEAALLFEKQNHHGEVVLTFRSLKISLYSHDVGGLTLRDSRMMRALDKIPTR